MIRDIDCTIDTPVTYGSECRKIYGEGVIIHPLAPSKCETDYEKGMYLRNLFPLEEYDKIIVMFSGGKDSLACILHLLELGVPKNKIELWHHDIDGGNTDRRMDWPVTQSYCKAISDALGINLRRSWRLGGYWAEVYRKGASQGIYYEDNGAVHNIPLSAKQIRSETLRLLLADSSVPERDKAELEKELMSYGYRYKFPAKGSITSGRWCSAYLKIMVAEAILRNLDNLSDYALLGGVEKKINADYSFTRIEKELKVLIVSGERRGESAGRTKYNEMEMHKAASTRKHRIYHTWRPVIEWSEKDVWEIIKRWKINPSPCYSCGWNRMSCMMCIFSQPSHWRGIEELFPEEVEKVISDEKRLGFTLDNKVDLTTFMGEAQSCVVHSNPKALKQLVTGEFGVEDVFCDNWEYPAGAFHGSVGGPC